MKKVSATTKMQGGASVEGLNETLKAFRQLDKDAQKAVREETQKVANLLAREVAAASRRTGDPRDAFVGGTVRGTKDRTPVIKVGKAAVGQFSGRPRASDLMFGMEFGSSGFGTGATDLPTARGGAPGWRFPERTSRLGRGNEGRWLYPTVRSQQSRVVDLWARAIEKAATRWGRG